MTANRELERVKCPHCGDQIVKGYTDQVKLRAALLKWTATGFYAVCKSCTKDVRIDFDLLKSINTRFVYETKK